MTTTGEEIYLYVLIEHQSTVDFSIPFRVLLYLTEIWRDIYKNTDENECVRKSFHLPPVFPIVLYNGDPTWTAPRTLHEMVAQGELFGDYIPHVRYSLVDISSYSDEEILAKRNALASIFFFEKRLGEEKVRAHWDEIWDFLDEEDSLLAMAIIKWLCMNLIQRDLSEKDLGKIDFDKITNIEEGKRMIQSQIDKMKERERKEGEKLGKIKSKREAILRFLKARFGEVSDGVEKTVSKIESSDKLDSLVELAATCEDLDNFAEQM